MREFHPRLAQAQPGSPELAAFKRADAQLVVARSFGFPSWAKLKAYIELTQRYSRSPANQPVGEPIADDRGRVDEFLRLACLNYGNDDPERWAEARELLTAYPELATKTIHTIAAVGDVAAARTCSPATQTPQTGKAARSTGSRCSISPTPGLVPPDRGATHSRLRVCCSATAPTRMPATCGRG